MRPHRISKDKIVIKVDCLDCPERLCILTDSQCPYFDLDCCLSTADEGKTFGAWEPVKWK